jgi:hypothetical protein
MLTSSPISRVLSWTIIHLGCSSPNTSSNLPAFSAGHTNEGLFGLAPSGVYHATNCYQLRGALLPHPFSLTCEHPKMNHRRSSLCCTFRRLTSPRSYLALYPLEPGLSSLYLPTCTQANTSDHKERLPSQLRRETNGSDTKHQPLTNKVDLTVHQFVPFLGGRNAKPTFKSSSKITVIRKAQ